MRRPTDQKPEISAESTSVAASDSSSSALLGAPAAIAAIAETASHELLAAMIRKSEVSEIRAACERDAYWPAFVAAAKAGMVPENWMTGAVGRCVLNWASA